MAILDSFPEKCYEDSPPYLRHDCEQVKRLWSEPEHWSLRHKLKERGRILKEIYISHGWPPSTEALKALRKLAKAHFRILCLRLCCKLRNGKMVTEEEERMSYGRYAEALNELESCTEYRFPFPRAGTDHVKIEP